MSSEATGSNVNKGEVASLEATRSNTVEGKGEQCCCRQHEATSLEATGSDVIIGEATSLEVMGSDIIRGNIKQHYQWQQEAMSSKMKKSCWS